MSNRVSLESVCSLIVDCEHKTAPEASPGTEYAYSIGTPNIRNGRVIFSDAKRVDQPTFDSWTARATPTRGDIILTREASVGEAAFIDGKNRICLGQRTVLLRPDQSKSNSRFLHYKLLSPAIQAVLLSRAEGSTVPHLNVGDIRRLNVGPLPSLHVQEAIANILGALDDKIAINDRTIYSCIEMASSLLQHESNTAETTNISLKEAASWLSGGTPKTSESTYWSGDLPWISAVSLKSFLIGDAERRLTAIGATSGTKVVPPGTTICVVRGMSLKAEFRMGITMRKVAFGQDCKAFVPRGDITPHVLAYSLWNNRANVLKLVDEAGHGTGRLDSELLGSIQLTVPSKERMGQLEQRLERLTYLGEMRREESEKLGRLRDTLLPKLMSGQVRVRDAEKVVEDAV